MNKYDTTQGKYVNKVVYGNEVQMDISDVDVTASDVKSGVKFYLPDGSQGTGTSTFDVDSSELTATPSEVIAGKTFAAGGQVKTGTMVNVGKQESVISDANTPVSIQQGYHDGSGSVGIDATELAKLVPENIRQDVEILGVTGTMSGSEDVKAAAATVTPKTTAQTIVPGDLGDYNYITQVNVEAIKYEETANAAGGLTVTIGVAAV